MDRTTGPSNLVVVSALAAALVLGAGPLAGPALAGTPEDPEIDDPAGDHLAALAGGPSTSDPTGLLLGPDALDLRRAWIVDGEDLFSLHVNATSFKDRHLNGAAAERGGVVFSFTHREAHYQALFHFHQVCAHDDTLGVLPDEVPAEVPREANACLQVQDLFQVYYNTGFTYSKLCRNGEELPLARPGSIEPSPNGSDPTLDLVWNRHMPGQPFGHHLLPGESITDVVVEMRTFPDYQEDFACPPGGSLVDRGPDEGSASCVVGHDGVCRAD